MTNAAAVGAVAKQLLPPRHCCTDPIKEDVVSSYYLYYHKVEKEKLTAHMQKNRKKEFPESFTGSNCLGFMVPARKDLSKILG